MPGNGKYRINVISLLLSSFCSILRETHMILVYGRPASIQPDKHITTKVLVEEYIIVIKKLLLELVILEYFFSFSIHGEWDSSLLQCSGRQNQFQFLFPLRKVRWLATRLYRSKISTEKNITRWWWWRILLFYNYYLTISFIFFLFLLLRRLLDLMMAKSKNIERRQQLEIVNYICPLCN